MPEPTQLKRGKVFQKTVQADYLDNTKDGKAEREFHLKLEQLPAKKDKIQTGRADILITEKGDDFVSILEIKATDWDRIKPKNIKRNLASHHRQIMKYIDKYLMIDKLDVCTGIIYPKPPRCPKLRQEIETYLEERGTPAYWYTEVKTPE